MGKQDPKFESWLISLVMIKTNLYGAPLIMFWGIYHLKSILPLFFSPLSPSV